MITEAQAYCEGWRACMDGIDGRYVPSEEEGYTTSDLRYAYTAGWLDAMKAEDGEEPYPGAAGFGEE